MKTQDQEQNHQTMEPVGRRQERSALMVATVTSFMGPFMISSVNVALPAIQEEFSAGAAELSWVATAYLLATAVFLVPMGRLGDIHGRKKVFVCGLGLFSLSAFFSAFVGSMAGLIFMRVLQGLGGAMVVTTGMAILTSVFPPHRRGRAIGIYVAAVYVGLSAGPFVGGFLTQYAGWRSIFLAVTPIGLASVAIALLRLEGEWADAHGEPFDLAGSVLYALSLMLLVYGATRIGDTAGLPMLMGGLVAGGGFVLWEHRHPFPVFDVGLFTRNRLFTCSSSAALIHYGATFSITFLLSLYLQYIQGMDPRDAGMVLVAQPVCMAVFSPLAGKWSDRVAPRFIATAGMALTAAGIWLLRGIDAATPVAAIVAILLLLGIGFALFSSPNMNAIMGSVEKRHYGIASGTVAVMRLLGQMSSMAIATVVFDRVLGSRQITAETHPLFLHSADICFDIALALCCFGIFLSLARGKGNTPSTTPGNHEGRR